MEPQDSLDRSPIRIGISSCLLGEKVRFDGGHKHDRYLTETLGQYFEWVPVCPEAEIGLGTPRETIRLEQLGEDARLVTTKTGVDLTDRMRQFSKKRVASLAKVNLSGYIFKKDSPSCGMERVKVYQPKGPAKRVGKGMFAAEFTECFPNLPVEEEGRLCDPRLRENWVERVFAYHDLKRHWSQRWRLGDLVSFHTKNKTVLLAQDQQRYRELGRLVATAKSVTRTTLRESYEATFMEALRRIATTRKNVNVLQQICSATSQSSWTLHLAKS